MFVILTPLIAWLLLRQKIKIQLWLAVAMAITGLGFLSLQGWSIGVGESLTLLCALLFAAHIVALGQWSPHHHIYGLAFLQLLTVGVVSMLAAIPDGLTMPPNTGVWGAVLLTAVLASALAYIIQTWVQRLISQTSVAVTMTMEPVFAGLFGVMVADEQLTARIVLGGILIIGAMIITGLQEKQ
jgi:drug/metabolite transporter (DMT)-like permease